MFGAEVAKFDDAQRAYRLVRNIEAWSRNRPQTPRDEAHARRIGTLQTRAMFVAFSMLQESEAFDLLRSRFREHLADGIDLVAKFRGFLHGYPDYDERDRVRGAALKALLENEGSLRAAAAGQHAYTVGQCAREYLAAFGKEPAPVAKREEYLAHAFPRGAKDGGDVAALRALVLFMEYLKLSSWDWESDEEPLAIDDGGRLRVLGKGGIVDVEPLDAGSAALLGGEADAGAQDAMRALQGRYESWSGDSVVADALARLQETPVKAVPGAARKWLLEWFDAVNKKDASAVMAVLWRLAHIGKIREAFGDSSRYKEYWGKHLPPQLADRKEEFGKDPAAPEFLLPFLRHILVERLKMREEDAKLAILTLSNEARKAGEEEYAHMAYGDLKTGEFRWNA